MGSQRYSFFLKYHNIFPFFYCQLINCLAFVKAVTKVELFNEYANLFENNFKKLLKSPCFMGKINFYNIFTICTC